MKKFTAAKSGAVIAFYEETEAERAQYARALAKDLKLEFDRDAEETFLAALPNDRGLARQEIEKLALDATILAARSASKTSKRDGERSRKRAMRQASRRRRGVRRKLWKHWRGSMRSRASRRCARCCGACINCARRAR